MELDPWDPLDHPARIEVRRQESDDSDAEGGLGNVTRVVLRPPGHSGKAKRGHLCFDASYECGNLGRVDFISEYEYDLFIRPDTCNPRYRLWFNFVVDNVRADQRVIFNIVNLCKVKTLFRDGMTPLVKTSSRPKWQRLPGKYVYYHKSPEHRNHYILSFAFAFDREEDVYQFAFSFPFSYSRCQAHLELVEQKELGFFKRETISLSLQNRKLDVITISNVTGANAVPGKKPKLVLIMARSHPGESPTSFIIQGLIDFLVSSHAMSGALRDHVVIKIIPMMNPDGVFLGNYRCSLMGYDLNRHWNQVSPWAHPTLHAIKNFLLELDASRTLELDMVIDMHAHSSLMGAFIYGNSYDDVYRFERHILFPKLLAHNAEDFSAMHTMYNRDPSKSGTCRRHLCEILKNTVNVYTMEVSYLGYTQASSNTTVTYNEDGYFRLGRNLARTFFEYYRVTGIIPMTVVAPSGGGDKGGDGEKKSLSQHQAAAAAQQRRSRSRSGSQPRSTAKPNPPNKSFSSKTKSNSVKKTKSKSIESPPVTAMAMATSGTNNKTHSFESTGGGNESGQDEDEDVPGGGGGGGGGGGRRTLVELSNQSRRNSRNSRESISQEKAIVQLRMLTLEKEVEDGDVSSSESSVDDEQSCSSSNDPNHPTRTTTTTKNTTRTNPHHRPHRAQEPNKAKYEQNKKQRQEEEQAKAKAAAGTGTGTGAGSGSGSGSGRALPLPLDDAELKIGPGGSLKTCDPGKKCTMESQGVTRGDSKESSSSSRVRAPQLAMTMQAPTTTTTTTTTTAAAAADTTNQAGTGSGSGKEKDSRPRRKSIQQRNELRERTGTAAYKTFDFSSIHDASRLSFGGGRSPRHRRPSGANKRCGLVTGRKIGGGGIIGKKSHHSHHHHHHHHYHHHHHGHGRRSRPNVAWHSEPETDAPCLTIIDFNMLIRKGLEGGGGVGIGVGAGSDGAWRGSLKTNAKRPPPILQTSHSLGGNAGTGPSGTGPGSSQLANHNNAHATNANIAIAMSTNNKNSHFYVKTGGGGAGTGKGADPVPHPSQSRRSFHSDYHYVRRRRAVLLRGTVTDFSPWDDSNEDDCLSSDVDLQSPSVNNAVSWAIPPQSEPKTGTGTGTGTAIPTTTVVTVPGPRVEFDLDVNDEADAEVGTGTETVNPVQQQPQQQMPLHKATARTPSPMTPILLTI